MVGLTDGSYTCLYRKNLPAPLPSPSRPPITLPSSHHPPVLKQRHSVNSRRAKITQRSTRAGTCVLRVCAIAFWQWRHQRRGSSDRSWIKACVAPICKPYHKLVRVSVVVYDWCNKGRGMYYPVYGMMHIKEPLLLIGKSSPCRPNKQKKTPKSYAFITGSDLYMLRPLGSLQ